MPFSVPVADDLGVQLARGLRFVRGLPPTAAR